MNEKIGVRLIFDQDGEILAMQSEMEGYVLPRKEITEIKYVDLEYGEVNFLTHSIVGVDLVTKRPISELLPTFESPEQQRIRELEDVLLLQAESEVGGIL